MRWLWGALVTSAVALSSSGCGSSGSAANFTPGSSVQDASIPFDATSPGNLLGDASTGGGDDGSNSGSTCTPRTCADAAATCGPVADGCGGVIQCGSCSADQSCGGGGTPNACGAPACTPKTCADPSVSGLCGQQADGCGGIIAAPCVTCTGTQTCGGGGTPNQCGGVAGCVPAASSVACKTSGGIPMNCGSVADGCGGLIGCGPNDGGTSCPPGETCGGAGDPNVCGSPSIIPLPDGGVTVIDSGIVTSDSGTICTKIPQSTACSGTFDGGSVALCGPVSDGCGGTYTCTPACSSPDSCGGGGVPSVCGHPACVPLTVSACTTGSTPICGKISDGCGGFVTCPTTCTSPDTCTGSPSVCTPPPACTKLTCAAYPGLCGQQSDGCGGVTSYCNACTSPAFCGGGGSSVCGTSGSSGAACDAGLECDLTECDGGATTTLRGTIYDPAVAGASATPGNWSSSTWPYGMPTLGNPLYNVVVYVPNSAPSSLSHGQPSCDTCGSLYTGDPIVATTTDTQGNFVLTGVPVPTSATSSPWSLAAGQVPIVIQIGKWRREWVWPGVTACGTNTATISQEINYLHLPGKESTSTAAPSPTNTIDDLPQIAISTGNADTMECLFDRIGFSTSEYDCGYSSTKKHLHIFQGGDPSLSSSHLGSTTSGCTASSPSSLWDSDADMNNYDIVVLSCEGEEAFDAKPKILDDFTNAGGRAFASHFHYSWFTGAPADTTYGVTGNGKNGASYTSPTDWGTVSCSTSGGAGTCTGSKLATWYPGSNDICVTANDSSCSTSNDASWINGKINPAPGGGTSPLYTWLDFVGGLNSDPSNNGTPAANELNIQQSRMNATVTSAAAAETVWIVPDSTNYDYTVEDTSGIVSGLPSGSTQYFSFNTPLAGTGDAGTPYCGRVVYSDLHIGGASGDTIAGTIPSSCQGGVQLAPQEKALEYMLLDLSSCVSSDSNLPPVTCTPATSCPSGVVCGSYPDGCGGSIPCGTCPTGSSCVAGACEACKPLTVCPTNDAGEVCGDVPNGCGGVLTCATCPATEACVDGTCVSGCTPQPCPSTVTCGPTGNGCGGTIPSCGTCTGGATCGGGGVHGACGFGDADTCVPEACPSSIKCGPTGDGCGGLINCGTCPTGTTCGGGGTPGVCGSPNCTPATCASLGANCGQVADGCGGLTADCGTCATNQTCGGGGTANVCGTECTPSTCASLGLNCGDIGDGCGNVLTCGSCTAPDTCGGGGTPNVCGTGGVK